MKLSENSHRVPVEDPFFYQRMMFALVPHRYQTSEALGCSKVVFSNMKNKNKRDKSVKGTLTSAT